LNGFGIQIKSTGDIYIGHFINNKYEGKGSYYGNGKKYVGDWRNGIKDGIGILVYSSNEKYEGHWQNNNKHG
jgi:hypothetical protein